MKTKEQPIIQLDFSEEMRNSYRDYAMSVIIARALPDVRDGLKPVQRRILYAMDELSLAPDKPHRKSARIVGDTMGKYHPHGDSSIYDALVHMTEEYSLSLPLVDGHGNFGSIDGDGAAAMRYTEARLSKTAMTMLENLDKGLVPFGPNFDESEKEPLVLPATLPNLLINGTTGIAVGMATNMPPHNPGEVIDGVIALHEPVPVVQPVGTGHLVVLGDQPVEIAGREYMDNPEISTKGLMKYIKGPDFPTGAAITNTDDLFDIYDTGEGKIKLRAKAEIENGTNGRKNIVVTEIPYTVAGNKTKLLENLVSLSKDKVFDEIYDVRDESSKEGIRIVVEVKKDRNVENLLNGLYQKTALEDTYGVNMLAVKDKQPITFTLKGLVQEFVEFQEELYTKEYEHLLEKAKARLEIVAGLIKATDVIDLIIEILRGSNSVKQAKNCLMILAMPLSKLIGLELLKLHQENDQLLSNIEEYNNILGNIVELHKVIKKRLKNYKKQFGRGRRTILTNMDAGKYVEEVKEEDLYVLIDRFGYCKSVDESSYSRISAESLNEYTHKLQIRNTDKLCVFTKNGFMHQIKMSAVPKGRNRDKGVLIQSLCKLGNDEVLIYIAFEDLFNSQLLFATKNGLVKLVSGIEFETIRSTINATKLDDGDELIAVRPLSDEESISEDSSVVIITHKEASLRFPLSQVNELKKASKGVKGITMAADDYAWYAEVISKETETIEHDGKKFSAKKIKIRKRNDKASRSKIRE